MNDILLIVGITIFALVLFVGIPLLFAAMIKQSSKDKDKEPPETPLSFWERHND